MLHGGKHRLGGPDDFGAARLRPGLGACLGRARFGTRLTMPLLSLLWSLATVVTPNLLEARA